MTVVGKCKLDMDALIEEGLVALKKSWEGMTDYYNAEMEESQ